MLIAILAVIAPIFFAAALGFIWSALKQPYNAEFVSRLVMNIGCPCLIISTLSQATISMNDFSQVALATLLLLAMYYPINRLLIRCLADDTRSYMSSLTFANTGNMGVPICLFAFGDTALALALTVFMVTSMLHFSLGVAWTSGKPALQTLFKSPVFYSALLSIVIVLNQISLPLAVMNSLSLVGDMAIPLMLFSLGVSLHSLRINDVAKSSFYAAARLFVGFILGYAVVELLALEGLIRGVILIQAAMPSAVFNYLIAATFKQQAEKVAAVVVISTLMSFCSLPLLLWFVMQQVSLT
ncbi:MAG: AEC family transporter [Pseudomonadales bacterium]|nr:AEC family transporter [Pseudomonadales bacterium]